MPTYEYRCADCGSRYDTHEGFDAPSTQACQRCGGRAKRVFTPSAIVFKGSGWYITDSRKGDSATVTSNGNGSSSTPSTPPSSEPAPAAAADDKASNK